MGQKSYDLLEMMKLFVDARSTLNLSRKIGKFTLG